MVVHYTSRYLLFGLLPPQGVLSRGALEACLSLSSRVGLKPSPQMGPRKRITPELRARALSPLTQSKKASQGSKI
jgi:hypothetical protein